MKHRYLIPLSMPVLAALWICGCSARTGAPIPPGWVDNTDVRQRAIRAASETKAIRYKVLDEESIPSSHTETDPLKVWRMVTALTTSIRRETAPEYNFTAGAVMSEVALLDRSGRALVWFRIPGNEEDYYGPYFAQEYREAAKRAKRP